ncbi:MAG: L,D-transpeptidase [Pseudolabrys sp.]|nr:L,D-transpeptidase [Pseudolabrys sp.]MDP2295936.1 L,D-transpeptidase [Pseudolabrys sp.]
MSVRRFARIVAALSALAVIGLAAPARAELAIAIDKSTQRMTVALNGEPLFVWPVSTGAAGYDTPSGAYTPFRLEKDHFSREWDDAPMPHSIFFTMNGHAIHGSNHLKALGTPASHGCVRLAPKNAKILFDLVKQEGLAKTRVTLKGKTPSSAPRVARNGNGNGYDALNDGSDFVTPPRRRVQQRTARAWQEYDDGPRYFYYREAPPPPRHYGFEPSPFPFFGR